MSVRSAWGWLGSAYFPAVTYLGALVCVNIVPFVLYFDVPLYYDEALFLVFGDHLAQGVELYGEIADHKPPGIFFVATALDRLFPEPHVAGRVTVYVVHLLTAGGIGYIAARLRSTRSGAVASLLYLGGVYLPHFAGYFFLTEPFANLFLVLATVALFSRQVLGGVLAGVSLAIAGLFNQISLLIGLPVLCLLALEWRRDGGSLARNLVLLVAIGVGFLVPLSVAAWYFISAGTLDEAVRYTIIIPLTGYDTPFGVFGHVIALFSFLPVWVLVLVGLARVVRGYTERGRLDPQVTFLLFWLFLLGLPGATSLGGDHKLLFAFPPACIVAASVIEDGYEWMTRLETRERAGDRTSGPGVVPRHRLRAGSVVAIVGILVLSGAANGLALAEVIEGSTADQAEASGEIDSLIEGRAYTLPFRHYVYYFSEKVEPPRTFLGLPYSDTLTREIVRDLEEQRVEYILVPANRVTEENTIENVGLFLEARERIIDYANDNYRYEARTERFVIFKREDSGGEDPPTEASNFMEERQRTSPRDTDLGEEPSVLYFHGQIGRVD